MRNIPAYERSPILDVGRSSTASTKMHMNVIHGHIDGPSSDFATLIVFDFTTITLKPDRRVRRAEIRVNFTEHDQKPSTGLEIYSFAPHTHLGDPTAPDAHSEPRIFGALEMNSDVPVASTVVWRIDEDNIRKEGITDRFRTALLLRRREDSKFEMRQDINLTVSGFSFDRTLGGNLGKTGQSVIIDPAFKNWHLVDVDTNQLGKVNLDTLVFSVTRRTEETQLRMGRVAVQAEHIPLLAEATQELRQTTIQTAIGAIKRQDTFVSQASAPEPPQPIAVGKYFFAELWNREPISRPTGNAMNLMREPPGTTDQQMKLNQELGVLDDSQLHKYFPYVYEEPALPPAGPGLDANTVPEQKRICTTIGRRSDTVGCQTPQDLDNICSRDTLVSLTKFFNLPTEFTSFHSHDRGVWLRRKSNEGQDFAYFFQTPFYRKRFWSLVLLTREGAATGAAVLQADREVDVWDVLERAREYGLREGSNPLALLVYLFQDHVLDTSKEFQDVAERIQNIDKELLAELDAAKVNKSKLKVSEYGALSHSIYKARMGLVELQRRREFEAELSKALEEDLKDEPSLITLVDMFSGLSKSHELNVQSFPDRIESQRTVLYSLIAQQDAKVQFKLARETTKDSKAMKTLAIITIILLPATYMATLFAVPDLLEIKPGKRNQIYWGVTVPATFVLIVAWWLWVRRSASHIPGDEEEAKASKAD